MTIVLTCMHYLCPTAQVYLVATLSQGSDCRFANFKERLELPIKSYDTKLHSFQMLVKFFNQVSALCQVFWILVSARNKLEILD
jgi:hypothetical protein